MTTLFYDSFQNTNNWLGGNGMSTSINVIHDPLNVFQNIVCMSNSPLRPDTFSVILNNNFKSFTISFDYLGLPKSASVATNLGGLVSISDGGSLTDYTFALAGSIKNSIPPMCSNRIIGTSNWNDQCAYGPTLYYKNPAFVYLTDDSKWHHYSLSFTTVNTNIRIALNDFGYANYPEENIPCDSYFANLIITDSYGPSPFIATSSPENFRSILVDVLNQVANTVSYENSNSAININLGSNSSSGGYATGDVLTDIENIIGSNYADTILGDDKNNTLSGGDGNDSLTAGVGSDVLIGGNGNDKFIISSEITSAEIQDFEINRDVIDLRLFNNLNNFQDIKSSSQYVNGNTVINLGNSKTLTLSGINYNDLSVNNFIINTLSPSASPTIKPTILPTKIPTIYPTTLPTDIPSIMPSLPTFSPSLSPTTFPSIAPTDKPTINPTPNPTALYSNIINISSGGIYSGTSGSDNFILNSPLTSSVTGNEGDDRYTIISNPGVTYTITDFDNMLERIDIKNIGITMFEELDISSSNPIIIDFPNNQKLKLLGLQKDDISVGNFIFYSPPPTIFPTTYPSQNPTTNPTVLFSNVINIETGGTYSGTSASENFEINSPLAVTLNGGSGIDKFTISPHDNVVYTIDNFNPVNEIIDLSKCGVSKIDDLTIIENSDFLSIIINSNNQQINLTNIDKNDLQYGNFAFDSDGANDNDSPILDQAGIIGVALGGALLIGMGFCALAYVNYASGLSIYNAADTAKVVSEAGLELN